jgi:hypothetical protein
VLSIVKLVARAALTPILGTAHAVALSAAASRCIVDRADRATAIMQAAPARVRRRVATECGRSAVLVDWAHKKIGRQTEDNGNE